MKDSSRNGFVCPTQTWCKATSARRIDILTTLVPWLANVRLDYKKKLRGQADNLPCIEAMLATWAMHADILKGMMEVANEVQCYSALRSS